MSGVYRHLQLFEIQRVRIGRAVRRNHVLHAGLEIGAVVRVEQQRRKKEALLRLGGVIGHSNRRVRRLQRRIMFDRGFDELAQIFIVENLPPTPRNVLLDDETLSAEPRTVSPACSDSCLAAAETRSPAPPRSRSSPRTTRMLGTRRRADGDGEERSSVWKDASPSVVSVPIDS